MLWKNLYDFFNKLIQILFGSNEYVTYICTVRKHRATHSQGGGRVDSNLPLFFFIPKC